jgi:hypothetical protein
MQISLAKLRSLSEGDFRQLILMPLLRSMEFRDVTELHGCNEHGKDIVAWKMNVFGVRENYAIVAKACRISQGRVSSDVVRQIRECLGSPYRDPVSLQDLHVNRVIVATTRDFTVPAKNSILAELRASGPANVALAAVLDGDALLDLIRRHMPTALIWDSLSQAARELNSLSQHYHFFLRVGPTGPSVQVASRHEDAHFLEPIKGSLTVAFPATPEGAQKRLEFQNWAEHGTPVDLSPENIANLEMPQLLRELAVNGEITSVTLTPASLPEPQLRRISAVDDRGEELFALDYVQLTHIQGGSKTVTIDNRGQPIPFRVSLVLDKETRDMTLSCSFERNASTNVMHDLRWMHFIRAIANGARLVIQDWNSLLPIADVRTDSLRVEACSDNKLAMIETLALVQSMSGVKISLPADGMITNEDAANAHFARTVMQQGVAEISNATITFTPSADSHSTEIIGKNVAFTVDKEFQVTICGAAVQLGIGQVLCRGVPKAVDGSANGDLIIEASAELPFLAAFPPWLARRRARDEEADGMRTPVMKSDVTSHADGGNDSPQDD